MNSIEHYYKCSDIEYSNELEKKKFGYMNDYGYNFDSNKRKEYDLDRFAEKLKNEVHHNDINIKR